MLEKGPREFFLEANLQVPTSTLAMGVSMALKLKMNPEAYPPDILDTVQALKYDSSAITQMLGEGYEIHKRTGVIPDEEAFTEFSMGRIVAQAALVAKAVSIMNVEELKSCLDHYHTLRKKYKRKKRILNAIGKKLAPPQFDNSMDGFIRAILHKKYNTWFEYSQD